jgi:hypothetical protein
LNELKTKEMKSIVQKVALCSLLLLPFAASAAGFGNNRGALYLFVLAILGLILFFGPLILLITLSITRFSQDKPGHAIVVYILFGWYLLFGSIAAFITFSNLLNAIKYSSTWGAPYANSFILFGGVLVVFLGFILWFYLFYRKDQRLKREL